MQVTVHMVQRQAGGVKRVELGMDFRRAIDSRRLRRKKITQSRADGIVGKFPLIVHEDPG